MFKCFVETENNNNSVKLAIKFDLAMLFDEYNHISADIYHGDQPMLTNRSMKLFAMIG